MLRSWHFKYLLVFLTTIGAYAQSNTNVTGQLIDKQGIVWTNATVCPTFNPAPGVPGVYNFDGVPLTPAQMKPNCAISDGGGNFSITLPANDHIVPSGSSWTFQFGPNASYQATSLTIPISGATLNISSAFTAANAPIIVSAFTTPRAYATNQVTPPTVLPGAIIFNTSLNALMYFDGSSWNQFTSQTGTALPACNFNVGVTTSCNLTANYTVSTTFTISQSNVLINCLNGTTISQGDDNADIEITGNNVTFQNCSFNGNGHINQVLHPHDNSGFTLLSATVQNTSTSGYTIRTDKLTNSFFSNIRCATAAQCIQNFAATGRLAVDGMQGVGQLSVQSPSTGGSSTSVAISNLNLTPVVNGGIIAVQDASGSSNPIRLLSLTNINCNVTGTSPSAHPFGCLSIVQNVNNCSMNNINAQGDGEYIGFSYIELGVDGCNISNVYIAGADTHGQNYTGITTYGGHNNFSNVHIKGWGSLAPSGFRVYAQQSSGVANHSDYSIYTGIYLEGTGTEQIGMSVDCNYTGGSALHQVLNNIHIKGQGTLQRGFSIADDTSGSCPTSIYVSDNEIINATLGYVLGNVSTWAGFTRFESVGTQYQNLGTTTLETIITPSTINAHGFIPTALSPSIQSLCYKTSNTEITNVGCASPNQGVVTFTPTTTGWYRIIDSPNLVISGTVDMMTTIASNWTEGWLDFGIGSTGGQGTMMLRSPRVYAGNYGPIDQFRTSVDSTTQHQYLDVHITVGAPINPVSLIYYGQAITSASIVAAPVVGATAGANNVKLLDTTAASPGHIATSMISDYISNPGWNGVARMTAGTVTITPSGAVNLDSSTKIYLSVCGIFGATVPGTPYVSALTVGTSFTVTSTNAADDSNICWETKY